MHSESKKYLKKELHMPDNYLNALPYTAENHDTYICYNYKLLKASKNHTKVYSHQIKTTLV